MTQQEEIEGLRLQRRRLGTGCVILALGVISMVVALHASESGTMWSVKRAYERGLDDGTVMKNDALQKSFMAGYNAPHDITVAAPAPSGRGPLDLAKLTPEQIKGLHCYIQSRQVLP